MLLVVYYFQSFYGLFEIWLFKIDIKESKKSHFITSCLLSKVNTMKLWINIHCYIVIAYSLYKGVLRTEHSW